MADEAGFELVMPFVVVTSKGGPYDDQAYTAGWEMGALDHDLADQPDVLTTTVAAGNMPQVDLIAMRHGYTVRAQPVDQQVTAVVLERVGRRGE